MTPHLVAAAAVMALARVASAEPAPAPTPAAFSQPPAQTTALGADWWRMFGDATLDGLIEAGTRDNPDIAAAAARLAQAQALVRGADAARLPQVGVGASASRQGGPLINAAGGVGALYTLSAGLSYDLDLFGRLAKTDKAARLDARSRRALLDGARLSVTTQISATYLELRAADQERALLTETAGAYAEALRITEANQQAGLVPEAAVARAQADLASVEAESLALYQRRESLEHALACLVGAAAPDFHVAAASTPAIPPSVPVGLPSALLTRRPDLVAAEQALEAAKVRVEVARTAWLPRLSLTADGGFASPDLVSLVGAAARSYGLEILTALPIFDGGRRKSGVMAARADQDLAAAQYRAQVLNAFREVEDQLSALRLLKAQADAQRTAVEADSRSTRLLEGRFGDGLASRLELLDARRAELKDRRAAVRVSAARLAATVALVRALGGGWDPAGDR